MIAQSGALEGVSTFSCSHWAWPPSEIGVQMPIAQETVRLGQLHAICSKLHQIASRARRRLCKSAVLCSLIQQQSSSRRLCAKPGWDQPMQWTQKWGGNGVFSAFIYYLLSKHYFSSGAGTRMSLDVRGSIPIRRFDYSRHKLSQRECPWRPIFHLGFRICTRQRA